MKFDERAKHRYLACLMRGLRRGEAARAAGVCRRTVEYRLKADPAFRADVDRAEEAACDAIESALWQKAMSGHFPSIRYWLLNRSPERWKERRQAVAFTQQHETEPSLEELRSRLIAALEAPAV